MIERAFVDRKGQREALARRIIFGDRLADADIGIAMIEIVKTKLLAILVDAIGVVNVAAGQETQDRRLGGLDHGLQLPLAEHVIADELDLAHGRLLALGDPIDEIGAAVAAVDHFRHDADIIAPDAVVGFHDAADVGLHGRALQAAAGLGLDELFEIAILDFLVAFEGDAIEDLRLCHMHQQAPVLAVKGDVLEQARCNQRLQRNIEGRGIEPPVGRGMKIRANGIGIDTSVAFHDDGFGRGGSDRRRRSGHRQSSRDQQRGRDMPEPVAKAWRLSFDRHVRLSVPVDRGGGSNCSRGAKECRSWGQLGANGQRYHSFDTMLLGRFVESSYSCFKSQLALPVRSSCHCVATTLVELRVRNSFATGLIRECFFVEHPMRYVAVAAALLIPIQFARAAVAPEIDPRASLGVVQQWIYNYRAKPDYAHVPAAVRVLFHSQTFKEPENAGIYLGFIAGAIGSNPAKAEQLVNSFFPVPPEDEWVIVRAIAYSGLPDWRDLMRRVASKMPARRVMIDGYLAGTLPTLMDIPLEEKKAGMLDKLRGAFTQNPFAKDEKKLSTVITYAGSQDLLDALWGYYFATGSHLPIQRIMQMLPWSKSRDTVDKLTIGSMARYTLASYAVRDAELLEYLRSELPRQPPAVKAPLAEVVEAADTVQIA